MLFWKKKLFLQIGKCDKIKMYENLQKELESVREENDMLKCELTFAKEENRDLEKLLIQV